ncbi:helix-turn-helix domain-containing protein [Stackebrandtia albiflava]|uniref:helix-turn-helix domain-containing protein n=1 Tax=Stackebrandtia albiflava TaxID=406432 RepID=UPI001B86A203|nr:LuxR C-terminal-related transcriptional regulator [Stackebrandtia albiflava]
MRAPDTLRLNGSHPFTRPPEPPRLPADQLELLRLLATGLSDQAIGRRLDLSRRTVQRRVRSLMDSFGVQTRFQLGMRAATQLES